MTKIKLFNEFIINEEYLPNQMSHEYITNMVKKFGYNIVKKLSGGAYGFAYLLDNNNVLKITSQVSWNNAVAAYKLLNIKNEYLVDFYNVFEVKIGDKDSFYLIEMEYIDTETINKENLENMFRLYNYNKINAKSIYGYFFGNYYKDIKKMKKELDDKGISWDVARMSNFGIKNGHLCAFDLGSLDRTILKKIKTYHI